MKKKDPINILAAHVRIEASFLHECVETGAFGLTEFPEDPFSLSPAELARLRRLQRLCASLDIDAFAGSIIVDLLEQLEQERRRRAY